MNETSQTPKNTDTEPKPRPSLSDYRDLLLIESEPIIQTYQYSYAATTDSSKLGKDGHLAMPTRKAWKMLGTLILNSRYHVDFTDPEWARDLKWTIDDMAAEFAMMQDF